MPESELPTPKETPYWWDTAEDRAPNKNALPAAADVVVIGAGFTGVSASLTLAKEGSSVICVDSGKAGQGASTRNGGMIGSGHRMSFAASIKRFGEDMAIDLASEGLDAYAFARDLIAEYGIQCGFSRSGRFRAAWTQKHFEAMVRDVEHMSRYVVINATPVPESEQFKEVRTHRYHGGVLYHRHGGLNPRQFHDGLYAAAVEAGALIYDQTAVKGVEKKGSVFRVETERGSIDCGNVIIATNGYTPPIFEKLFRRVLPVPSFIIATQPVEKDLLDHLLPGRRMMVESRVRHCYYRRSPDDSRIVLGARAALTDIAHDKATKTLHRVLIDLFPELEGIALTHSWRGFTGFSFDHLPHVGVHDGMHFALGYSGSGVAMAPYLGYKVAMRVLGRGEGETVFTKTPFSSRVYYKGNPWFMPIADRWFNAKDVFENFQARG